MQLKTPRDLGSLIRATRHARQLSQAELASAAGVSRPLISEIENGKATARIGIVLRLFASLDLTLMVDGAPIPGTSDAIGASAPILLLDIDRIADTGLTP